MARLYASVQRFDRKDLGYDVSFQLYVIATSKREAKKIHIEQVIRLGHYPVTLEKSRGVPDIPAIEKHTRRQFSKRSRSSRAVVLSLTAARLLPGVTEKQIRWAIHNMYNRGHETWIIRGGKVTWET